MVFRMPRFQFLYCSTWSRVVSKLTQIKEYTSYFISYRWGWLSLTEGGVNPDFEWSWRGAVEGGPCHSDDFGVWWKICSGTLLEGRLLKNCFQYQSIGTSRAPTTRTFWSKCRISAVEHYYLEETVSKQSKTTKTADFEKFATLPTIYRSDMKISVKCSGYSIQSYDGTERFDTF